jgi:ABC-type amino acid transport substrate-binding protein
MSYTNTPRRALQIDFAGRLLPAVASALVLTRSTAWRVEDLDRPGAAIGVARGSSVADIATRRFPAARIIDVDHPFAATEAGEVDAIVECGITKPRLARHPGLRPLRDAAGRAIVLGTEYGHPAIRQGDPRFLNWLNTWLEYHRAVGTIDQWCGSYWTRWMI